MKLWSAVSTAVFSIALIAAMLPTAASAAPTLSVPSAPTSVSATAGNNTVTATWGASATDGGSAITLYTATASPGGATCTDAAAPFTCTMAGLNGTAYTITVIAANGVGNSPASPATSPVTPGLAPSIPGTPTVAGTGTSGEVAISWTASASLGGGTFTGYTATSNTGGFSCTTTGTTCNISGLGTTTAYTFSVIAANSLGNSGASGSSTSITPNGLPGQPTPFVATAGNGSASFTWTAPASSGGSAISRYVLTANKGGASVEVGAAATTATLTGLTNSVTYAVTIVAKNANGSGTSNTANVTPLGTIGVPTGVTAGPNGMTKELVVTWVPPASLGGQPFDHYTATTDSGDSCTDATSRTDDNCVITVTDATDGVTHTVSVHVSTAAVDSATNVGPESVASAPGASGVVPVDFDSATLTTAATGVSGEVNVGWTPIAVLPGVLPVTGYTVTASGTGNTCTATTGTSCIVTGQVDGTPSNFTMKPKNAAGPAAGVTNLKAGTSSTKPLVAPTAVTATAVTSNSATISWTLVPDAAASDGGNKVNNYIVTSTPASTFTQLTTAGSGVRQMTNTISVTGLSAGTDYTFTVHAVNDRGNSVESTPITVTPTATPGAPGVVISGQLTGESGLTVTAPAVTGGTSATAPTYSVVVTNVTTPASPVVVGTFSVNAGVNADVTGATVLSDGNNYSYSVTVTNNSVTGPATVVTGIAGPLAGAPTAGVLLAHMLFPQAGSTSVLATGWTAGTGTPTGYTVNAYSDNAFATLAGSCSAIASPIVGCTVTGLSAGTAYWFGISTQNIVGSSAELQQDSGTNPLTISTLPTVPGAPSGVTATSNGNGQSVVSWTAPSYTGGTAATPGAVTYDVTATEVGTSTTVLLTGDAASPGTVTGLTNGKAYTFTVKTVNSSSGTSAASAASAEATPVGFPNPPTGVTGAIGNGQVVVSWTAPVGTNGAAVDGYQVLVANPAAGTNGSTAQSCTATGTTSCTVTGLVNGQGYTFKVAAQNSSTANHGSGPGTATSTGWSNWSATSSATFSPAGVAGAPTGVSATAGAGSATVTWSAPSSNGDSAIILYEVLASPGGATCLSSGLATHSCSVPGLTNGTSYTFTTTAVNLAGTSLASAASAAVEPRVGAALDTTVNHAFTDVGTVGSEAANAIAALFNTTPAITQGMNATTYGPLVPVNRANMAVFLSRSIQAVGHTVDTAVNHAFTDVAGLTTEQQSSIAAIGNTTPAITTGVTATSYEPSSTVSRQGMAAFLSRTWESLGGTCDSAVNHSFGDIGTSSFQAEIACVNNLGIANGVTTTTFEPAAPVNRLQMALFLFRLVDAAVAQGL